MKGIAKVFKDWNIEMYYVGGCVRDEILGIIPDDVDICLVGGKRDLIHSILEEMKSDSVVTNITSVFGDFPIWIVEIDGEKYEFAMARTERKTGDTHQSFECETSGVTIEQDLERRDLTINAIAKHVLTDKIIDPFCGMIDLKEKRACNVSKAFGEDPLRVIRAARFIARFGLRPHPLLLRACSQLSPEKISKERIGKELMKFFEKGGDAFDFFGFLSAVRWLSQVFPEVYNMIDIPQSKIHHPEGDVYTHTMHCVNAAQGWFQKTVMLCHDMGKVTTTTIDGISWKEVMDNKTLYFVAPNMIENMKIQALGHEEESVRIMKPFLQRICFCSHRNINRMSILVKNHMIRASYNEKSAQKVTRRTLRELMHHELAYLDLVLTVRYDLMGRPPLPCPDIEIGQDMASNLISGGGMIPIVTGKLLIENGFKPDSNFRSIIDKALELQDRGTLNKENWKQRLIQSGFKQLKQAV